MKDSQTANRNFTFDSPPTSPLLKTYPLVAKTDAGNVITKEAFAKLITDQLPVGEEIVAGTNHMKVIGVVKDFVYGNVYGKSPEPLYLPPTPMSPVS